MKMKPLRILFFVAGPAPTAAQMVEAEAMNAQIMFRNALVVPTENHAVELADAVAGEVPAIYAAKYPSAEAAIEARAQRLEALSAKVGDEPAPKPPAKAKGPTAAAMTAPAAPAAPAAPDTDKTPPAQSGAAPTPPAGWNANAKTDT